MRELITKINYYCKDASAIRRIPFKLPKMKYFSFFKNEIIYYDQIEEDEKTIVYWYSDTIHPHFPMDSSGMFQYCSKLSDISGLADFDLSKTKILNTFFLNCVNLRDIGPIAGWNTSNLNSITKTFEGCVKLKNLNPISKWNVSNVNMMISTFEGCTSIRNLKPIKDWNIIGVIYIDYIFDSCDNANISDIYSEWKKNIVAEKELKKLISRI